MDQAIVFDPIKHHHLLPQFTEVHMACITVDYTIATFLPPLQHTKMLKWWEGRAAEVVAGVRSIVFLQSSSSDGSDSNDGAKVAGVVMLSKPPSETGPFRGFVEKLLVSPSFRKRGVARKIMEKVEEVSQAEGRWLMVSKVLLWEVAVCLT
jgi:ribosomal protein S18 acetylase RimI-like enzyme